MQSSLKQSSTALIACDSFAAATQADAVALLLSCLTAAGGNMRTGSKSLQLMQSLMAVDSSKDAFMRAGGASQLADFLSRQPSMQAASSICASHHNVNKVCAASVHRLHHHQCTDDVLILLTASASLCSEISSRQCALKRLQQ